MGDSPEVLSQRRRENKPLWKTGIEAMQAAGLTTLGIVTLPLFLPGGVALMAMGARKGMDALFR